MGNGVDEGIFTKTDLTLRSGGVRRSSWAHLFCILDVLSIYERFGTIAMVPGDENLKKLKKSWIFPKKVELWDFLILTNPVPHCSPAVLASITPVPTSPSRVQRTLAR